MSSSHRLRAATLVLSFLLASGAGALVPAVAASGPAGGARPIPHRGITGWTQVGSTEENTLTAGQGVATVAARRGSYELYRGDQSVPADLNAQGWSHIGDPDSLHGYLFDAYQGPSSGTSKMFLVTTPTGRRYQYVHTLVRGELYNNSFDAISPDGQWMIGGEWGTMNHLQIYPTPLLNHRTAPRGGALRLAGLIKLDHQVNDVQGCDFVTSTHLICASDDDSMTLFPDEKPLVEVVLSSALHGSTVKGHVVDLGPIPQVSSCAGTFEAEGLDFDAATGVLRLEIIQPGSCILNTTVLEYREARGRAR